ncbi:fimbrial protein [Dyella mobilis]|uniref:Type 1 fimbrial protein n=1 Tax=Dyella mobilis TaxID=1849582 RepID=A0ABS2KM26_9GAMM|nr:fimbrial protein [Dyella mobilis]MBM7132197.1 type 1 fimbrial protein [Dyella mobilis]GLQ95818.1 fimbrial protein [Dyella mobilis]
MKKLILSAALIAGLGVFAANSAMAADGTITFNGQISAVTCTVHGDTPGGTSGNFTVTLPTVASSAFGAVAAVAGSTGYNIIVGGTGDTGCTDGTNVSVHYESTSPRVDLTTGNLQLDPGTGVATGVQIQILDGATRAAINLATAPDSSSVTVASNTATIPFFAQYISTAAAVTAGPANSSVLYTIAYN